MHGKPLPRPPNGASAYKLQIVVLYALTIGLISGSGGNFDNLIDKQSISRFPCCTFLTIHMSNVEKSSTGSLTDENQSTYLGAISRLVD